MAGGAVGVHDVGADNRASRHRDVEGEHGAIDLADVQGAVAGVFALDAVTVDVDPLDPVAELGVGAVAVLGGAVDDVAQAGGVGAVGQSDDLELAVVPHAELGVVGVVRVADREDLDDLSFGVRLRVGRVGLGDALQRGHHLAGEHQQGRDAQDERDEQGAGHDDQGLGGGHVGQAAGGFGLHRDLQSCAATCAGQLGQNSSPAISVLQV